MWCLDYDPETRRLDLRLSGLVPPDEMREIGRAHALALEATGGQPFVVLIDLRGLHPLGSRASDILADIRRVAASLPGYRGRSVLVNSATIAMQQRNLTLDEGGDDTELITMDEPVVYQHLQSLLG